MKFEVKQDRGMYVLMIDNEKIIGDTKLSTIVKKIESYLKMRYLKEEEGNAFSKLLGGFK